MKPMTVLLGVALVALVGCVEARPDESIKPAMANPLTDEVLKQEWNDYKTKHNKVYENPEEDLKRVQLYLDNKKTIAEHNAKYEKGLVTWSMGLNQFSDQTPEEKKSMHGVLPIHTEEEKKEWNDYKTKFNKTYSFGEDQERMNLFLESKKKMEQHNADFKTGKTTFLVGINQFSDQRPEENKHLAGVLPKPE